MAAQAPNGRHRGKTHIMASGIRGLREARRAAETISQPESARGRWHEPNRGHGRNAPATAICWGPYGGSPYRDPSGKKKIAWGAPCVDASRRRGHCGKLGALGTPGVREYGTGVKPTGQSRPSSGHLEHLLLYTDRVRVGTMPLPSDRIRRGCRHRTGSRPSHPSSSTTRATISLAGLR